MDATVPEILETLTERQASAMAFIEDDIQHGEWIEADGTNGVEVIPADLVDTAELRRWIDSDSPWTMDKVNRILRDYVSGTILSVQIVTGYGARLSAAGYMDCTEWSVFSSIDAAKEYLRETYHDDEADEADEDEDTAAQHAAYDKDFGDNDSNGTA